MEPTTSGIGGAIGDRAIGGANPVTGGSIGGVDTIGTGDAGDRGAGLDAADVRESEASGETVTTSGRLDGKAVPAETDREQSGVVGENDGITAAGGI